MSPTGGRAEGRVGRTLDQPDPFAQVLVLLLHRWGNAGAIANARSELVWVDDQAIAAMSVEQRIRHRDTARTAEGLRPAL